MRRVSTISEIPSSVKEPPDNTAPMAATPIALLAFGSPLTGRLHFRNQTFPLSTHVCTYKSVFVTVPAGTLLSTGLEVAQRRRV